MAQAWFVSDLHLTDMQDEKAGIFLAFLSSLGNERPCTHLFLVGDIFDLWVGDHDYFTHRFRPIIDQLLRLVLSGTKVIYFEGNHDLHLSKFFQGSLGAKVYSGPEYFKIDDQIIRVEHGDEADPEDKGYLFLRWFLRTPVLRSLSYGLPGPVVSAIGERASAKSRKYTSNTKSIDETSARKKLHEHAERAYAHRPFNYLINGHVHLRDNYKTKNFEAINLGTWLKQPGALQIVDGQAQWIDL